MPAQAWAGWTTDERLRFVNRLPRKLSTARLRTLDTGLALSDTRNNEVLFAWLSLAVANRYDPAVPALASRAGESLPVSRIALSRWDVAGTGQLAAALLGVERVSAEFAEHLWQRASGLPLAVRELVGLLVERGTVAMHDGEMMRRGLDELEVPGGARGVAIAVDAAVVPRAEWETTRIDDGARVEVVRAIQGG